MLEIADARLTLLVGCISRDTNVLLISEIRLIDVQFKPEVLGERS